MQYESRLGLGFGRVAHASVHAFAVEFEGNSCLASMLVGPEIMSHAFILTTADLP